MSTEQTPNATRLVSDYVGTLDNEWFPQDQNEDTTEERRALIFDGGNRGRGIGEAIIAEAKDYGFEPSTDDDGNDHSGMDDEHYHETTDEAIEFLNDLLSQTAFSFYLDGDFFFCETREIGEDAPGITPEEREALQAIDDADESEHRPGVGKIVCKHCNHLDCDYDCDESQVGGFEEEVEA